MTAFQKHYNKLNEEQRKAVDLIDGPVLVLAGPGTGKTQLLSVRAANILRKKKIDSDSILILTFTNAAAREMRERLASIIGHPGYNVVVETFHSFANSIVLESEEAINYAKDRVEMGDVEKVRAIKYILDNVKGSEPLRPFGAPYIHRREIEKRVSELKNEGISPASFKEQIKNLIPDEINLEEKNISRLNALAVIYDHYEKLKDEGRAKVFDDRGRIDYDDMILIALEALKKEKNLSIALSERYKYIMVDEYQDTNRVQLDLLFGILDPAANNVCCVGDDDQSIYRFQGASLSNFIVLRDRFPSLKEVSLKSNYRSTPEIIGVSRNIIAQIPPRERVAVKDLKACEKHDSCGIKILDFLTEEEELYFLVKEIKRSAELIKKDKAFSEEGRSRPYNNIAVLVRTRQQISKIVNIFLKEGIPYATDGKEDIRGEKRVRQILDILELANVDANDMRTKSLVLYKILTSDYIGASHTDILKFIGYVNGLKTSARSRGEIRVYNDSDVFTEFQRCFPAGREVKPEENESKNLEIAKKLKMENPRALHIAAWAVNRLLNDAKNRPVHDLVMSYIDDAGLYRHILESYDENSILRTRDLRSLVSFINTIKIADLANTSFGLDDFMEEMELREIYDMPIQGELATINQDGVRLYTVHASKGHEFYAVFMPFCLDQKSWPVRSKPDVVPLPPDIYKSKERVEEKKKLKLLKLHDELRLFYVATTRAKAHLIYTFTPAEKAIMSPFLSYIGIDHVSGSPKKEEPFLMEFLNRSPREDSVLTTGEALKDLAAAVTLTPTTLNNYITCPRKFLYNRVLSLPGKKNQSLVFGNCAHKALEEVYSHFMDKKKFPNFDFFKIAFKKELVFQAVNDSIKNWCLDRLNTLEGWYKEESRDPVTPHSLERDLKITLDNGLVFKGKFDKVEILGAGVVQVVDYKTGKPDKHIKSMSNCIDLSKYECDDYYRQLVAYKLVFDRNKKSLGNFTVVRGKVQFLEPVSETVKKYDMQKGVFKDIIIDITDSMVAELEKVIADCWKDIQAMKFDKLPEKDDKDRCKYCEYSSICWE